MMEESYQQAVNQLPIILPSIAKQIPALIEWTLVSALLVWLLSTRILNFIAFIYFRILKKEENKSLLNFLDSKPYIWRLCIFILLLIIVWLPMPNTPIIYYLRGFFGDLSVITIALSVDGLYRIIWKKNLYTDKQRNHILSVVLITGSLFFPFAIGIGSLDPYNLGYSSLLLWFNLLLISVLFWSIAQYHLVLLILLAIFAWIAQWHESNNLWDYLIDANIWVISLFSMLPKFIKIMIFGRKKIQKT